tara:strand:- start:43 stop:558 length:516 start_codon:yes stop_codon:yes gene_type:complete
MTVTTIPTAGITDATIVTADLADDAVTAAKAAFSPGKIGQVLSVTIGGEVNTTTGSYADVSGLSLAITPSATSSKIMVQTLVHADSRHSGGNSTVGRIKLFRDSTELEQRNIIQMNIGNGEPDKIAANCYHSFLDSPSSTSAVTYKYQFSVDGGTFRIGASSKIILLEVLA